CARHGDCSGGVCHVGIGEAGPTEFFEFW
nr:immunoglobulin heavy chain junction region [Macaca mulatta]MOV49253.1 immunoglobulin heavy chain junction region [Macaca mulatta]MOV49555.1 immunoglobulin heavy chain junction region [Macaca mulatta]MOV49850.1 immunoglobulin heavy chain junction region [Macaca mulatta]MOV50104.1 immunoglobulin heavy chain junction region [Macaca mulatta]